MWSDWFKTSIIYWLVNLFMTTINANFFALTFSFIWTFSFLVFYCMSTCDLFGFLSWSILQIKNDLGFFPALLTGDWVPCFSKSMLLQANKFMASLIFFMFVLQYTLDFVYLSVVMLFTSPMGKHSFMYLF